MKIIVTNERKVSEYFGVQVEKKQDLMEIKNTKVEEFITKYQDLFLYGDAESFNNFYQETGLFFTKCFIESKTKHKFYLNELGLSTEYSNKFLDIPKCSSEDPLIFRNHFVVILEVNELVQENDNIYILNNNQKTLIFEFNKENKKEQQAELFKNIDAYNIKQIKCIYPYYDLLILLNDGTLYLNNKIYSTDVREINVLNSYNSVIIYQDNRVEYYTFSINCYGHEITKYQKVISRYGFLATLDENNTLYIISLLYRDEYDTLGDYLTLLHFKDVLDIDYVEDLNKFTNYLLIKKNKEEIKLDNFMMVFI